jgi:hypothetical protein
MQGGKVFCFSFSKKKYFLASPVRGRLGLGRRWRIARLGRRWLAWLGWGIGAIGIVAARLAIVRRRASGAGMRHRHRRH